MKYVYYFNKQSQISEISLKIKLVHIAECTYIFKVL